jgi:hypothetical protein
MIPPRLQTAIDEAKAVGSRAVPVTFDELALIIEAAKAEGRAEARQAIPAPWLWATGPYRLDELGEYPSDAEGKKQTFAQGE